MAEPVADFAQELSAMLGLNVRTCRAALARTNGDPVLALDELLKQPQAQNPEFPGATPPPMQHATDEAEMERQMAALKKDRQTRAEHHDRFLNLDRFLKAAAAESEEEKRLRAGRQEKDERKRLADEEAQERRRISAERRKLREEQEEFDREEQRWREQHRVKVGEVDDLLRAALADSKQAPSPPAAPSADDLDLDRLQREAKAYLQMSMSRARAHPTEPAAPSTPQLVQQGEGVLGRQSVLHSHFLELPLVSVYWKLPEHQSVAERLRARFLAAGVLATEVKLVDYSADYELAGFLKAKCPADTQPVVLVRDRFIGVAPDVIAMSSSLLQAAIARARLGQDPAPEDGTLDAPSDQKAASPAPKLGMVGSALEKVETVLDWLKPWKWGGGSSSTPSPAVPVFNVVLTNWYYRQQRRQFRFLENVFMRVHPNGEVRAVHAYAEVQSVKRPSPESLVLVYSSASPDHLEGAPEDVAAMLAILRAKAPQAGFEDLTASTLPM